MSCVAQCARTPGELRRIRQLPNRGAWASDDDGEPYGCMDCGRRASGWFCGHPECEIVVVKRWGMPVWVEGCGWTEGPREPFDWSGGLL